MEKSLQLNLVHKFMSLRSICAWVKILTRVLPITRLYAGVPTSTLREIIEKIGESNHESDFNGPILVENSNVMLDCFN